MSLLFRKITKKKDQNPCFIRGFSLFHIFFIKSKMREMGLILSPKNALFIGFSSICRIIISEKGGQKGDKSHRIKDDTIYAP